MFTKIAIIGTGNIGTWLLKILQNQNNISVISVSSRKIDILPCDFDLYVFALKDDVYEVVLKQISFTMPCAVHTSGSLSQNILAPFAEKYGVIYPYQTILRNAVCGMRCAEIQVPVCVEASGTIFENALLDWTQAIFNNVHKINEQQRFAMHLAAVFACNFTNAMYGIAYNIFKENKLDWSLMFPLLEQTLTNAKYNDPHLCQTGPAVRNDISIMKKHCKDLNNEDLRLLYKIVSKIIQQ